MTSAGRWAGPAHSTGGPSRPSRTRTSTLPNQMSTPAAIPNRTANQIQPGRSRAARLTSKATSAARPNAGGHHHHGTVNRSRYRTDCDVAPLPDTRRRVVFWVVSTPLAVMRLDPDLPLPSRAHDGDAGVDLYSAQDVKLDPGQRALVRTGVAVAVPFGMVGLVHPRSGLAARVGLSIVNSPGTIDAGYRGEIKVALINLDPATPIVVHRGDRIAQLLVQRVELVELVEVSSFDEAGLADTSRGHGGHGSSGGHASL